MTRRENVARFGLTSYDVLEVGFQFGISFEIPECQTPYLIKIVPVGIQLGDVLLSCFVLGPLRVVQVQGAYLSYHKGLYAGVVALLGYRVGLSRYFELLCLVVEVGHQKEDVLHSAILQEKLP